MKQLKQSLLGVVIASSVWLSSAQATLPERPALRDKLQQSSPFIPPDWTPPAARPSSGEREQAPLQPLKIELRGHVDWGEGPRFSLYDPEAQRSFWLSPGEQYNGIEVLEYGSNMQTVVISQGGRRGEIRLIQRSDTPLPVAGEVSGRPAATNEGGNDSENDRRRRVFRNREGSEERMRGGRMLRNALRNAESDEEREAIWRRIGEALGEDTASDNGARRQ